MRRGFYSHNRWVITVPITVGLLVLVACGEVAVPAQPPTDTPRSTAAPPAAATAASARPAAAEKPAPISEEQLREELKRVRFSTAEWASTNFLIHRVPLEEFTGGGPGKDDIPSIDTPKFEALEHADKWLDDREPVQVVEITDDVRAYPQQILIWHEIVNDTVGGEPVTITY